MIQSPELGPEGHPREEAPEVGGEECEMPESNSEVEIDEVLRLSEKLRNVQHLAGDSEYVGRDLFLADRRLPLSDQRRVQQLLAVARQKGWG